MGSVWDCMVMVMCIYLWCLDGCARVPHKYLQCERATAHFDAIESPRDLFCHLVHKRLCLPVILESDAVL